MMNEESQEENAKDDDNMRFHRGGILLEMLAEVASQTLSDSINALRSYDTNECPNENVSSTQTISPNVSQSVKKKQRRRGCKASPAFSHQVDICSLSPQRLLRLFSRLDCNELKRTFTYTCTLQPETCFISFTSFGSEAKARKQMTLHLQEHTTWLSQQTLVLHESPDASTLELGGTQEVEDTPIQVESTISIEEIKNDGPDDSSISNVLFDHSYSNVQEVIPIEVWPIDQSQMNRFMLDETVENQKHKIVPLVGREEVITSENQSGHTLRDMLVQSKNKTVQESVPVPEIKTYDKNSLKRKPKGKAKFIGQSNSDKVLALSMIEQIKQKQLSPIDSLECRICCPPRTFTAPTTLLSHYRSHAGIKPFECSICRAAFTRQHSLNYHLLIHSNETRFTCKECGRKFRHPSHFREHQRRHTGEAPYECQRCSARFKTRNTFKRHLKTRHNEELGAGTEDRDSPPPRSPQNDSSSLSPEPSSTARLSGKARKSAKRKISESTSRTPEPVKETSAAKVQKRRLGTPEVEPKALYINPPVKLSPNDNNEYPGQASMSLNHFAEIAKAILTQTKTNYDEDDEDNNNTHDVSEAPIVDTVITFQCAPALAEAIANSDQKKSIVMMV